MANSIAYRDIRVQEVEDIQLQPTDTWVQVFYGNDTEPSERGFYNAEERNLYGVGGLRQGKGVWPYTLFVAWYNDKGYFQGSSSHPHYEESEFPVDREVLLNGF